jgi:uncharacterized protein YciI
MNSAHGETNRSLNRPLFVVFSEPGERLGELAQHIPAHIEYMVGLEKRGALFMSGPFLDTSGEPAPSGMWIVRASNREEAHTLAAGDPFHFSGARAFRVEAWQVHQGRIEMSIDLSDQKSRLS